MKSIAEFFNCGKVSLNRNTYVFRVFNLSDINEKIIPFFKNYPIQGVKYKDFQDFIKVYELMKDNKHLTIEGLNQIKEIKANMNSVRK